MPYNMKAVMNTRWGVIMRQPWSSSGYCYKYEWSYVESEKVLQTELYGYMKKHIPENKPSCPAMTLELVSSTLLVLMVSPPRNSSCRGHLCAYRNGQGNTAWAFIPSGECKVRWGKAKDRTCFGVGVSSLQQQSGASAPLQGSLFCRETCSCSETQRQRKSWILWEL